MSLGPNRKEMKLEDITVESQENKRENDSPITPIKRTKTDSEESLESKKRKNFVSACEIVSYQAFCNYRQRLLLICLPCCVDENNCKHDNHIRVVAEYVEGSFKMDMRSHAWYEALEICNIIKPGQYLSANILKDLVEIMMNAHGDEYSTYTADDILHSCQQILTQNFTTYPPNKDKHLRICYENFLISPMAEKEYVFSNRVDYGHNKGTFEYCIRRLDYELNINSKDGPLVNIDENIPEDMKESVKGMHFKKEKLEIFETLKRLERIKRIMVVLESLNLLLQNDLAIWHSRFLKHNMRRVKPFMAIILWSNNDLKTGNVTNTCSTIMKLFIYFIHLKYPKEYIKILLTLLNAMIQTFHFYEDFSNTDYPEIGKYCSVFARQFLEIMLSEKLPHQSIINVLENIQPHYMQYRVATLYLNHIFQKAEDDVIKFFIYFVDKKGWEDFPTRDVVLIPKKPIFAMKKVKSLTKTLLKQCATVCDPSYVIQEEKCKKFDPNLIENEDTVYQDQIVFVFYIALQAYLEAYSILQVQETLDTLNNKLLNNSMDKENSEIKNAQHCNYSLTEKFVKKYRSIYLLLSKVMLVLTELHTSGNLPQSFRIYETIGLLEFKNNQKEE